MYEILVPSIEEYSDRDEFKLNSQIVKYIDFDETELLISAVIEKFIIIFEVQCSRIFTILRYLHAKIDAACFSPQYPQLLLSISQDCSFTIWDLSKLDKKKRRGISVFHSGIISSSNLTTLSFDNRNNNRFAIGDSFGVVYVWELTLVLSPYSCSASLLCKVDLINSLKNNIIPALMSSSLLLKEEKKLPLWASQTKMETKLQKDDNLSEQRRPLNFATQPVHSLSFTTPNNSFATVSSPIRGGGIRGVYGLMKGNVKDRIAASTSFLLASLPSALLLINLSTLQVRSLEENVNDLVSFFPSSCVSVHRQSCTCAVASMVEKKILIFPFSNEEEEESSEKISYQEGKEEKYQKGKKIRRGGKSKIENYEKIENIYPIKSPPRKKKLPRKENLRPSQATFDRLHRTYVERDAKLKALREFEHSVDLQTGQNLFVPQINPTNLKRSKNSKMYRNPDSKPVGEYLFDWKKKQIEKRKAMQQNQTNKRKMLRNGSSVSRRSEIIFAKSQKRKLKHLYQNLLKSKDVKQQLDITTADFSSVPKSTGAMVRRLFKNSENHFIEMNEFVNVIENGMVKWAGTHEGIELRHALNDFFRLVEPRRSEPVPSFTFRPKISRKSRRLVKAREKREEAEYSNFSNSLENEKTIAANEKKEDFFSDALAMIDSVQTSWEIEEEKEKVGAPEEQTRGKEEVVVKKKKNGLKTE
eukprot:g4957.t1